MKRIGWMFFIALLLPFYSVDASTITLLPEGVNWRYLDTGGDPNGDFPISWTDPALPDNPGWPVGRPEFGYGDGDEATVISYGGDPNNKHITYYFRRGFNYTNVTTLAAL